MTSQNFVEATYCTKRAFTRERFFIFKMQNNLRNNILMVLQDELAASLYKV